MDLNLQEFHANMQGGPSPLQRPRGRELGPIPFHVDCHGRGCYIQKCDCTPRMRGASNGPESPPTPEYFQVNPSYPPGFGKSHVNAPGLDDGHRNRLGYEDSHGEMNFQESLEITSDRPFLPRRRAPSGGCNVSIDQIPRVHNQGTRDESCGPSQNLPRSVRGRDCAASDGGPSELLPTKMRKKTKFSPSVLKDIQPAHADTIVSSSSFEEAMPPSVLGKSHVPRSGGATGQKSSTNSFELATKVCQRLWEDLNSAVQQRERVLREKEQRFTQSATNDEAFEEEKKQAAAMRTALEEEKKQAAAMKNELMEERRKLEEEAQRIREEKDAMERTSTEIALQMVELKQVQKQLEKEKATLLALKADLSAKESNSQGQDYVEAAATISFGTTKAETEEAVTNPRRNCGKSCTRESDARPSNIQNQVPKMARDVLSVSNFSRVASNRNFESVKVELMNSGCDAARRDKSRLDGNSSEDNMDDLPLAHRLKSQRFEKRREKRRVGEKTMQQEDSNVESSRRRKSLSHDIRMKRNKVAIEVALQEDAPGLLEQLEEKGLLEDMSIYQDMGSDDSLASESPANEFGQLEGVVGKLWGAGAGLAKDLIPVKGQSQGSGNMSHYCLACLLSLIEQTKLLRKRNWPVEWGWCRRLRAFVFVFEKHNRVVLERPEYGYATYFFELVQRLPVKWQVQRLITVMSVASTGRAALLENRQLVVGTDLTDEEAAILEDYGWNRSSGLGSLLNFCDRVVHDYNKGQDPEELGNDWKQKIGKLLMDGYDQGSILATSIPRKLERVLEFNLSDLGHCSGSDVKAEPL